MYDFVEVHDGYTISRKFYEPTDPRLKRHVAHDSRSLNYQVEEKAPADLKSVRHPRHIPTLDQGQLGSCTGEAGTGAVGSDPLWDEGQKVLSADDAKADQAFALQLYSDATKIDPYRGSYPPNDTGSDGLSVAKVLKNRKLISGYLHATTLNAALTALEDAPFIAGVEWREDMFKPDADGRVHITGAVAGGHEIVFDELDVEKQRVWFNNSWGDSWGVKGRGYLTWDDFGKLLKAQGDVTKFVPISVPAPTPTDPTLLQEVLDAAKAFVASLEKLLGFTA